MADNQQDPKPRRQKNPLLYLSLVAVLFGIGIATFWIDKALAENPYELPPSPVFMGVLLAVVALVIGVYTLNKQGESEEIEAPISRWRETSVYHFLVKNGRYLAVILSIGLMFFVLWRLPQMPPQASYSFLFWLWLAAAVLYLWAAAPTHSLSWDIRAWWLRNRSLILLLTALILGAFMLRFWQVGSLPFTLSGDEGSQGLEAVRVLDGVLRNPFTTGWLGVPTMSFFFNSWSIALFGRTIFGLRFPWVLVGSVTILAVFFLVKRLMGMRLAVVTAVILATYHYHIHYSRLGSNQIADPFFLALALLFLYRALDRKNSMDWALTGMVSAVALYFYAGARLTPVIIIVVLGYLFVRQPREFFPQYGRGILVAVGAFLLVAAPMIQYGVLFPNDFNARVNEVGIIQSGWLKNEIVVQQTGVVPILFDQFRRAALAFNFYEDRTVWYGLRQPLLSPFWGILFLVGMGYSMLRLFGRGSNPRYAPMVVWWWGGMLLGGFLTESPPSSQRLITLSVPVSFFLAVAMWQLIRLILAVVARKGYPKWVANGLLTIGVIVFGISSVRLYFAEYLPMRIYGGPHAEMATMIVPRLLPLRFDHEIYFVGPPHMYWGFSTLPYLVPDASAQDIREPIDGPVDVENIDMTPYKGAVFIFHPQRVGDFAYVEAVYPGGAYEEVFSPVNGRLMATLYVLPPDFQE
ncbi:MAG: hypothetical protein GWP17_02775 [Aquificales bacterium]|nr:hypothetical protein [Aquificales bacterium]